MTFPLTPASPYVAFTTVITSAALNAYRVCINEALDGTGGGTYAPMAQLVLGGSGLKLTGATALELDGTSVATQDAGGIFNINGALNVGAGAYLDVEAGGTLSVAGTSASLALVSVGSYGVVQVGSGGALTVASGGTETVAAGGALNVLGGIFVGAGGGISRQRRERQPGVAAPRPVQHHEPRQRRRVHGLRHRDRGERRFAERAQRGHAHHRRAGLQREPRREHESS